MHDPFTLIGQLGPLSLWHRDRGGQDGACGWFMRARHGDADVLRRIDQAFAFVWDASYGKDSAGNPRADGLFFPQQSPGQATWPALSIHAVALQLFHLAAYEHFGKDRAKAVRWLQAHLFEILLFAENPHDSVSTGWTFKYGIPDYVDRKRRIHETATVIYGWILRQTRPWYRHPRWHVHHWRLRVRLPRWFHQRLAS